MAAFRWSDCHGSRNGSALLSTGRHGIFAPSIQVPVENDESAARATQHHHPQIALGTGKPDLGRASAEHVPSMAARASPASQHCGLIALSLGYVLGRETVTIASAPHSVTQITAAASSVRKPSTTAQIFCMQLCNPLQTLGIRQRCPAIVRAIGVERHQNRRVRMNGPGKKRQKDDTDANHGEYLKTRPRAGAIDGNKQRREAVRSLARIVFPLAVPCQWV